VKQSVEGSGFGFFQQGHGGHLLLRSVDLGSLNDVAIVSCSLQVAQVGAEAARASFPLPH
ncbi:MAG: hypothetical protein KAH34_15160, partial [Ketobacter sp.]|nr:hypothetical protein [Ketobacter sp.]